MFKIVIVDDDANIRNGLELLIPWDELNIRIVGKAKNGEEALALIAKNNPHIVLTDIRMTQMDGLQLIEKLREVNQEIKIIVLSGYNEYEFIRKAMKFNVEDYLLKPVIQEELLEIMKTICVKLEQKWKSAIIERESQLSLRENLLIRWIENRIELSQLIEKMDLLGVSLESYSTFQVAVVTWKQVDEISLSPEELQFRPYAIHNAVHEAMQQQNRGISFLDSQQRIVALFMYKDWEQHLEGDCLKWLEELGNQVASTLKVPWFCALGSVCQASEQLSHSYLEAMHLLDYMHATGSVICIDKHWSAQLAVPTAYLELEQFLTFLIQSERKQWTLALQQQMKWADSQPNSLLVARAVAAEWLVLIRQTLRKLYKEEQAYRWEINRIQQLFALEHVDAMHTAIQQLVIQLEQEFQRKAAQPEHTLIGTVKLHISEHLAEDLSLKVLAHQLNVNSSYLGQLFKDDTGHYFSDYVHALRLEKAKYLLTETVYKASEISKLVGFSDPNYFFRKFKRLTGVSPSEFRKLYSKIR